MPLRRLSLAIFLLAFAPVAAQQNVPFPGAIEVEQSLAKLNNLGAVLMIAAHPDDEQTAVLAWFARGRHMRTAYLSLTRGEGGQNLIGPEQGPALGVIRTQYAANSANGRFIHPSTIGTVMPARGDSTLSYRPNHSRCQHSGRVIADPE